MDEFRLSVIVPRALVQSAVENAVAQAFSDYNKHALGRKEIVRAVEKAIEEADFVPLVRSAVEARANEVIRSEVDKGVRRMVTSMLKQMRTDGTLRALIEADQANDPSRPLLEGK
jgi:hypothetical protein